MSPSSSCSNSATSYRNVRGSFEFASVGATPPDSAAGDGEKSAVVFGSEDMDKVQRAHMRVCDFGIGVNNVG